MTLLDALVAGEGDALTVFDISLDANRASLERLLAAGARVRWFDHHFAGEPPVHPSLRTDIDPASSICTSLIVDRCLDHRHARWAAVGAFGDNLAASALALCASVGIPPERAAVLRRLGEAINYNAYGDEVDDLMIHPAELHRLMAPFDDPFVFLAETPLCERLSAGREDDLARADALRPSDAVPGAAVYRLDDAPWVRRVRGAFGNRLVEREPQRAFAIASMRADGSITVSVRVPPGASVPAYQFCRRWPGGGGREIAAGIDRLDATALEALAADFIATYGTPRR